MTAVPETHYARSADGTNLAYQLSGDGPLDLVLMHGTGIPFDLLADDAGFVRLRKRLDTFCRTVWFEGRGMGASEGDPRDANPGEMSEADLTAVLDAVGFDRPALVAEGTSGGGVIHYSVTRPERVSALVLVNSFAHYVRDDDYPWGVPSRSLDSLVTAVKENWGTGGFVEVVAPSRVGDERFRAWYARSVRFGGGPDQIAEMTRAGFAQDARKLLYLRPRSDAGLA